MDKNWDTESLWNSVFKPFKKETKEDNSAKPKGKDHCKSARLELANDPSIRSRKEDGCVFGIN
jgi:hypothetical protein